MRSINYYTSKPKAKELIPCGNGRALVCVRENIKKLTSEEGEISYSAVEYSTTVIAKGFTITDEFVAKLKAADEANEAKRIRTLRGQLLADCDYIMLSDVDKTEEEKEAWKAYRQALRDIPEQSGFPWNVVFPEKP